MAEQKATPEQISQFVKVVDDFEKNYAKLISQSTQDQVRATNDQALFQEYDSAVVHAGRLHGTILATVGAWNAAKSAYQSMIDKSSMIIGDTIDWVRSWFGYDPAPGINGLNCGCHGNTRVSLSGLGAGLGAVQIPAMALGAVWITGIVAAAVLANKIMAQFFVQLQAAQIRKGNPKISVQDSFKIASDNIAAGSFFAQAKLPMILLASVAAFYFWNDKR